MSNPSVFLGQVFTRKLVAFAGNTLLVYDYLLTLPLEVAHIWNAPWTLVKALFLINRYGNLVGQTFITMEETGYLSHGSRNFCVFFQFYWPVFTVFSGESIRFFIVMRTCAILGLRRGIAWFTNTVYVLYGLAIIVVGVTLLMENIAVIQFEYLSEIGICVLPWGPADLWMYWLLQLLIDGSMVIVTSCSLYRSMGGTRSISSSPLIRLLVRDGIIFYTATLFHVSFAMVCWSVYREDPRVFLQVLITYPVLSVTGQRLVLNLRHFRSRQDSTHDLSREVNRQIAAMANVELELIQLGSEQDTERTDVADYSFDRDAYRTRSVRGQRDDVRVGVW